MRLAIQSLPSPFFVDVVVKVGKIKIGLASVVGRAVGTSMLLMRSELLLLLLQCMTVVFTLLLH